MRQISIEVEESELHAYASALAQQVLALPEGVRFGVMARLQHGQRITQEDNQNELRRSAIKKLTAEEIRACGLEVLFP